MPGAIIRWLDLEKHIAQRMEAALADLEKATTDREVGRAQGRLEAYRQMRNLPETIQMLTVPDKEATTQGG